MKTALTTGLMIVSAVGSFAEPGPRYGIAALLSEAAV